jgi:hypothetical protein
MSEDTERTVSPAAPPFAVGELQGRRTAHRAAVRPNRPCRAPSVRLTGDEQPSGRDHGGTPPNPRPAASLWHAVGHQAVVGLMAERAGFPHPESTGSSGPETPCRSSCPAAPRPMLRLLRAGTASQDQFGRGLDNEPERDAARDVERQMGPDVDTGQPDQGDDA